MNHNGYRLNGGIGFSIASPTLNMSFEASDVIKIVDNRKNGFTTYELKKIQNHLFGIIKRENLDQSILCVINDSLIQSHIGFGSNTMIYLSCVEALLFLNHRSYTENDVVRLSGRGGTSGIGVNTYFKGGFIFDTGVKNSEKKVLAPSSSYIGQLVQKPLLFKRIELPQWELGLCIPNIINKTEDDEKKFFQSNCPIEKEAVKEILYESVYGITSALIENDFNVFCKSIDAIQQTKWKVLERSLYGEELFQTEINIRNCGAKCVGMSSLGPMLYFFGTDIESIVDKVRIKMPQCTCIKTVFNNSSRIVEDD